MHCSYSKLITTSNLSRTIAIRFSRVSVREQFSSRFSLIINTFFRLTQPMLDVIKENLDENCSLTLENLIAIVLDMFDVVGSVTTMHNN